MHEAVGKNEANRIVYVAKTKRSAMAAVEAIETMNEAAEAESGYAATTIKVEVLSKRIV